MKKNSNEKFTIITFAMAIIVLAAILIFGRIILPVSFATILATISIFLEKLEIDEKTAMIGGWFFIFASGFYLYYVYEEGIKAESKIEIIGILIRNIVLILIGSVVVAWLLLKLGNIFFDGLEYVYNIFYYNFYLGGTLSFLLTLLTIFIGIPYVFYRFYRWFKKEYREKIRK
ncbi:hypothetical protein ES702_01267 [subsurface metagenome]